MLEPLIAELYTEHTGRELMDPGDFTMYPHPDYPWLLCTPDRLRVDTAAPVEFKSMSPYTAQQYRDGNAPISHQIQLQVQIDILGCDEGDLAALIRGVGKFFPVTYQRNDRFLRVMLNELRVFRERCLNGDEPPADGSQSTTDTLKALHPDDDGRTVLLTPEAVRAYHQLTSVKADMKALEKAKRRLQNQVSAALGSATFGEAPGLLLSYKTTEREAHEVHASKFRVLREEKPKGGNALEYSGSGIETNGDDPEPAQLVEQRQGEGADS